MTNRKAASYGKGEHVIDDDSLLGLHDPGVLLEAFRSPNYQPPVLPQIAVELIELTRRPEVDYQTILSLLERDPMIAAKVLRAAQSVFHGATRVPVQSLREALVRLGLSTLTQLFLEVTLNMTLFRVKGYEEPVNRLRRHCSATAYIARAVAHATGQSTEHAFLCGLLHDVGMLGALMVIGKPGLGKIIPPVDQAMGAVVACHTEAGQILAKLWRLPSDVQDVLRHHHSPRASAIAPRMAAAICIADAMATELGEGIELDVVDEGLNDARLILPLDEAIHLELRTYAERVIERIE